MLINPAYVTRTAAPTERARLAEASERHAAGASFLSATAYGVGGMIEDYLTYSRGWGFRPPDEGHHFFRRRLEEIMTVLLRPDQGRSSLSVDGARALLAARGPA